MFHRSIIFWFRGGKIQEAADGSTDMHQLQPRARKELLAPVSRQQNMRGYDML
jgi:hypothetical protein